MRTNRAACTFAPTSAWNGWYHVTGGTYGTWLRGDGRGWRDRKHRTHVDDRAHQVRVYGYVLEHVENGAWTWSFRQGAYWRQRGPQA